MLQATEPGATPESLQTTELGDSGIAPSHRARSNSGVTPNHIARRLQNRSKPQSQEQLLTTELASHKIASKRCNLMTNLKLKFAATGVAKRVIKISILKTLIYYN